MDNKQPAAKEDKKTEAAPFDDRHALLKARLSVAKAFVKKAHKAWKEYIKEYEIDDIADTEQIRDKARIGYIFRRAESDMPAIFDDQPDLFLKGRGRYRIFDPYLANTYDFLWDIQSLEEKIEDVGLYFLLIGMGFMSSPWVTEGEPVSDTEAQDQPVLDPTTGQPVVDPMTGQPQTQQVQVPVQYMKPVKNQPDATVENPFKIYFSPETKFAPVLDYKHCPYYFVEHTMSAEEIESRFGKKIDPEETLHTDITEVDTEIENLKDKEEARDDLKRALVYEYYGCLPKAYAKNIKDDQQQGVVWDYKKDYHVWMTENEELQIEECQYPHKPLKIVGNYGLANKFFKFGDAKHLKPLVRELEQYRTQILRHTRKIANPKLMAPTGADVDEDALRDPNTGKIVKYTPGDNGEKPEYMIPGQLGAEVGEGIAQVRTDLDQTSGSFSLSQGSNQSTVKTPRGIQTFSEAADRNVRRKRKKLARFIKEVIKFQFLCCGMNWDPTDQDVVDIIFGGEEQPKVTPDDVIKVLADPRVVSKVDIEVESMSINRVEQKQEALDFFDICAKYPNIFNVMEAAKDLVQNGFNKKDADRYLISTDQMKSQVIQEFLAQIAQVDPALAGKVTQIIQQPNMAQLNQSGDNPTVPQDNSQGQLSPASNGALSPMPPIQG